MMAQGQEHIATLCAVGTIGIAATGLALGTSGGDAFLVRPGKRKAPGEDTAYSSRPNSLLFLPRRAISQPLQGSAPEPTISRTPSTSLFRRKPFRDTQQDCVDDSSQSQSRGSSLSRHGLLRPFSRTRDASAERKTSRPASSWINRMSMISILDNDTETSSVSKTDDASSSSRPQTRDLNLPNKLVKRAASMRAFSTEQAQGSLFRKPATSHQRLAASSPALSTDTEPTLAHSNNGYSTADSSTNTIWRPFFDNGYSRKRHTSGSKREEAIKTITVPYGRKPTLLNGSLVHRGPQDDIQQSRVVSLPAQSAPSTSRRKLRSSLGSVRQNGRQRNFTEPVVHVSKNEAYGSILPARQTATLSPLSNASTFDMEFPRDTPASISGSFAHNLPHRSSPTTHDTPVAQSDPTTASSENDVRVFTDDDSMDFHSDTAYDSLATRATASSHSGYQQPKINTIFDVPATTGTDPDTVMLERLMQDSSLERTISDIRSNGIGIGISGLSNRIENDSDPEVDLSRTPVKMHHRRISEDISETPIPLNIRHEPMIFDSSPPTSVRRFPEAKMNFMHGQFANQMSFEDEDEIDWSPKPERELGHLLTGEIPSSPTRLGFDDRGGRDSESTKRLSIFDWSEQHKLNGEVSNGLGHRPKTVHGKQGAENGRSRPVARKPPNSVHLRSQSVPVNRDSMSDADLPSSAVKFGTWGLGKKPVSEEWSDDFEFDDDEGDGIKDLESTIPDRSSKTIQRDSVRSVVVPQSIIDRQASVHLQFGQVQEFMLLVEELKRLRARGAALQLLEGYSKHLWDDAENIINLATLNDEDDGALRPPSPTSSDVFADDKDFLIRDEDSKRSSLNVRAISNPATPPFGRARGESLAQAKSFLQTIHQNRNGNEPSPVQTLTQPREKLPFDSQDLRDLVIRAGNITRSLKEMIRRAEGVSVSPQRLTPRSHDPSFRELFNPPDTSPCPPFKKPGLPKSRSAHSYLSTSGAEDENDMSKRMKYTTAIEAN